MGLIPDAGFTRGEQVPMKIGFKPRLDDLLSVWAEVNHAVFLKVLGLVGMGAVLPYTALHFDVDCPDRARLAGTATCPELQVHHRPNLWGNEGFDGRDMIFADRLDRLGFNGFAVAEAFDGAQGPPDRFGNQLAGHHPFENLPNPGDVLVDALPADPGFDQLLTGGHQCDGADVGGCFVAIQPPEGA